MNPMKQLNRAATVIMIIIIIMIIIMIMIMITMTEIMLMKFLTTAAAILTSSGRGAGNLKSQRKLRKLLRAKYF